VPTPRSERHLRSHSLLLSAFSPGCGRARGFLLYGNTTFGVAASTDDIYRGSSKYYTLEALTATIASLDMDAMVRIVPSGYFDDAWGLFCEMSDDEIDHVREFVANKARHVRLRVLPVGSKYNIGPQ
jgi:hypothetical protein